jgi:hypothetical protein
MKKPILYMIAIAIVGLLITSASSLPVKQTSSQEDEINAEYLVVQSQPLLKTKNIDKSMQPLFYGVPITGGDYDEYHPSVAGSPLGGFYAMVEETLDGSIWDPTLYGSTDGVVWEAIAEFLYDNAEYTDMDQNAYGTYGTYGASPNDPTKVDVVYAEDYTQSMEWDFNNVGSDFINNHIACYTFEGPEGDPGTWNFGGVAFTGYNNYQGANIYGCPFIIYPVAADSGVIGWLTGATASECKHVGSTMDLATNMHYAVYDRNTGSGNYELLVRKDNFGAWVYNPTGDYWTHSYVTSKHVNLPPANLTYPSITAYNNNVIVTCQKDDDVVVFYSINGFTSYTEVLVQTSASYPEVCMAAKGLAVLTYIKDGLLYYRTSDTKGATWSDAQVVSDNEVKLDDRAANLDEYKGSVYGTWEDTRGPNIDAYFDIIYEYINNAPLTPTIDGTKKIKKDVQYEYTFTTTDPDGDDVYYWVDWGDGANTGWIGPYASSAIASANHTWTKKDKFTIGCQAKDAFGATSDWAYYTVSAPRARLITFRFLDYFPNAFPLLRLIFGY